MFPGCQESPRCVLAPVPMEDVRFAWGGPATGNKAMSHPATKAVWVDPEYWDGIHTVDGRAVIFCHEWAHLEGAKCERCADWRAGQLMAQLGFPTPRDALRAMRGALEHRDSQVAAQDVRDGFYGLDVPELEGRARRNVSGYRNGQAFALEVVEVEQGKYLATSAAAAWLRAKAKAAAAGVTFGLESGFRFMQEQQELWERYKDSEPGRAARPGYSPHQAGIGADVNGPTTAMRERAMVFLVAEGFERLSGEPWHLTYRGTAAGSSPAPRLALGGVGLLILALALLS